MASINPTQDYDAIHTLTFASASGTCRIRLYRGSYDAYTGTVYYRAGTSGAWTSLSVSGTSTTFPVTSTTMQVAHDWNKDGNNYMTPSFYGQSTNLVGISISQKAVLSGTVGDYFMYYYAYGCSNLTSLSVPDTSGLTSVGGSFIRFYAQGCTSLTSLSVPDTSGITSVANFVMGAYADGCSSLTSLDIPDTSGITTAGTYFMLYYADGCSSLTSLILPAVGWFATHNIKWSVPSDRLGYLKGYASNTTDRDNWRALTTSESPNTLYLNYIRSADDVILPQTPVVGEKYALPPFRRA